MLSLDCRSPARRQPEPPDPATVRPLERVRVVNLDYCIPEEIRARSDSGAHDRHTRRGPRRELERRRLRARPRYTCVDKRRDLERQQPRAEYAELISAEQRYAELRARNGYT